MIKKKIIVQTAVCDSCKASLRKKSMGCVGIHYGELKAWFGFSSKFDSVMKEHEIHLCENCWENALKAVGLDPYDYT